jgi:peroxiredoxin
MALKVGDEAPNATVFLKPREPIQLDDYRGKPYVLLFFPLAFSGTCTQEMCSMAEDYSAYQKIGAEVVGISVDSPYVNQKFAESCNAKFPILSDFNKEAAEAYGVLRADLGGLKGVSERAAFVVDAGGKIRYTWLGENPGVMPPLQDIKKAVESAAR